MNKTVAVIIVLLVSVIFIGGISVMAVNSEGQGWPWDWHLDWNWDWFSFRGERVDVDESADFSPAGVTEVDISLPFGNVDVEAGEPGAELKGYFNVNEKKDQYLFVTTEDGKLRIEFDPGKLPVNQNSNLRMTVRLPQELAAGLRLTNSSCDIHITGISAKGMTVPNSSGNMDITGCSGGALDADLTSGNLYVTDGDFTGIDADCHSGNVRIENKNGPINVQNTSGNININAVSGTVCANNSSGNIDIYMSGKELSGITAKLSSGNLSLYLDPQAAFTLDARTSSGNVSCGFDILVSGGTDRSRIESDVGGGGAAVKLTTSSGNVNVQKR
jgi:DUF4097 and DUF4098 domain-containing protein YvlB